MRLPPFLIFFCASFRPNENGRIRILFVENGEIHSGCRSDIPNWVIGKIAKQIFIESDL